MSWVLWTGVWPLAISSLLPAFAVIVSQHAVLIIGAIGSAMAWILAFAVASSLALMAPDDYAAATLVFLTVLLSEVARIGTFHLHKLASPIVFPNKVDALVKIPAIAIANGLGMAIAQIVVHYADVFTDALGPATYYLPQCPQVPLMVLAAMLCCIFGTMQMLWSVLVFTGMRKRQWILVVGSLVSHFAASFLTLASSSFSGSCVPVLFSEVVIMLSLAYATWRCWHPTSTDSI